MRSQPFRDCHAMLRARRWRGCTRRADEMNDLHARRVLHSAAYDLGHHFAASQADGRGCRPPRRGTADAARAPDPRLGLPPPAGAPRPDRRDPGRGPRRRHRRGAREGRAAAPLLPPHGAREGAGAGSRSGRGRARGRHHRGRGPPHPRQARGRGRGARLPGAPVGPAPQGVHGRRAALARAAVGARRRDDAQGQAPGARRDRRLPRHRRLARQGWRLRHPGPRPRPSSPGSRAPTPASWACRSPRRRGSCAPPGSCREGPDGRARPAARRRGGGAHRGRPAR